MAKHKERQALALSARLSTGTMSKFTTTAFSALEAEVARVVAEDAERRSNGKASFHLVMQDDRISGFVKDANTLVRFADGVAAVTTRS